jgi:hypothetical protein
MSIASQNARHFQHPRLISVTAAHLLTRRWLSNPPPSNSIPCPSIEVLVFSIGQFPPFLWLSLSLQPPKLPPLSPELLRPLICISRFAIAQLGARLGGRRLMVPIHTWYIKHAGSVWGFLPTPTPTAQPMMTTWFTEGASRCSACRGDSGTMLHSNPYCALRASDAPGSSRLVSSNEAQRFGACPAVSAMARPYWTCYQ